MLKLEKKRISADLIPGGAHDTRAIAFSISFSVKRTPPSFGTQAILALVTVTRFVLWKTELPVDSNEPESSTLASVHTL